MKLQEIKISYKRTTVQEMTQVKCSNDIYKYLLANADMDTIDYSESFYVVYLNRANRILGFKVLSMGGMAGTVADIRTAFAVGLKCAAHSMIIAHNHPSGNTNPSGADEDITYKFKKAGDLINIPVLDHIIFTSEGYYSFADMGKI